MIKTLIEKGRKIKSRGIALTHKDQGYSANGRHVSLLTKSDVDPSKLTVDVIKSLEQVQLTISMEEFLRRFFHMWSDDAELLTKALGMKTEFEQSVEDNPPEDEYDEYWNERHREYIDERLSTINIIKKAKEGEDLSLIEQFELIKTRKEFEDGCNELGISFDTDSSKPKAEVKAEATDIVVKSKTPAKATESSTGAITNTNEETPVEKEVDVTKSAAFIEMQKALEEMKAEVAAAQEIIKANKAAKRAVAVEKAAGFTFVAEDQREAIADVIENPAQAAVVAVLEKAAAELKAKEDALLAKEAEIEEVKKSFASGNPVGAEGDLTPAARGAEDAQARLNRIIEAKAEELAKAAAKL